MGVFLPKEHSSVVYNIHSSFEKLKQEITEKYPKAEFLDGQCYLFAFELSKYFKGSKIVMNNDHCMLLHNNELWDYRGCQFWTESTEPRLAESYKSNTKDFINGT